MMGAPQPQPQPRPSPAQPEARPGRHLRAASAPRPRLMPTLGWVTVVAAVAALFALALLQSLIVDRQATLDGLNQQLEDVRAVNERLRLNVARAEAPERIVAEAMYRLGMVEPDGRVYLSPVEFDEGGQQ